MEIQKKSLGSFTIQWSDGKIFISDNSDEIVATFTDTYGFYGENPLFDAFLLGLLQIDEDLTIWNESESHYTVCSGSIYLKAEKRYAE